MDIESTVAAIAILRDTAVWYACAPVGQSIRTRAYLRLERELTAYLTGDDAPSIADAAADSMRELARAVVE